MKDTIINVLLLTLGISIMLVMHSPNNQYVCGRIRVGDLRTEILTTHGEECDCCPSLWNGGIATTPTDLSNVRLYDMADIITLDGGHYVMECVEIVPCIRVGRWLIGWRGVVKVQGDIIVYNAGKAYRFTML